MDRCYALVLIPQQPLAGEGEIEAFEGEAPSNCPSKGVVLSLPRIFSPLPRAVEGSGVRANFAPPTS